MATLSLSVFGSAKASAQPLELRPNIQALPAFDISLETDFLGRPTLRFGTTTWNSGDGPLELVAGETGQDRNGKLWQKVYQVVYLDDGTSYRHLAGKFVWHPSHNHFHVEDYAYYTLQSVKSNGKSKFTSSKTSFCLSDTDLVDGSLPGAPKQPFYSGCGDLVQGISVGWGDEYGASIPGQEFDVTDLPDGDYRLIIDADPKDRLLETNDGDNTSCVLLRISVSAMTLEVLNADSCDTTSSPPTGDLTVTGITPNQGMKGTQVSVTISGTGFQQGMSVNFENGSGPALAVSDVNVVDSTTILATVTIKNGGNGSDPRWDLRVDTSVLPDAFTVLP